jgi:formylglycine-generating enzyme required for sulfatase activity
MRLFVSYARVDKPYCIQIVSNLDVHDVWYDQRMYAGVQWWKEILRRLEWCEGFIYLLSPDSLASEYCRREYELALSLGKNIFPVRIHDYVDIPDALREVQYVDLSKGLTPDAVRILLNSIYVAEKHKPYEQPQQKQKLQTIEVKPPTLVNANSVISYAATAMENGHFDKAVYLLRQAKGNGYTSKFINIDALLHEAESSLERQSYLREAEREYKQIAELVKYKRTRSLGCEAFTAFNKDYPDFDPDCLAQVCEIGVAAPASMDTMPQPAAQSQPVSHVQLPLLEWCEVPTGIVMMEDGQEGHSERQAVYVDNFQVSKYPITNAQYQCFLEDPMGYGNLGWWQYSAHAHNWRVNNPTPKPSKFRGDERPRETVTWYDAMAFCHWLSALTGLNIGLPTEAQWQRAAQGDDNRRFPWGNTPDFSRCNVRESGVKMTTLVMRYPDGVSPFGIYDLIGNVWEWCLDAKNENDTIDITTAEERSVHGGSFVSVHERSEIGFHYHLNPQTYYASIGFRIVQNP